jgi:signal transduction histidine kinase
VARESIANAAKHADADTVRVSMRATGGTFVVEIVDDGTGFDPEQVRGSPGHLGIRLIRERVAEAGGTFGIEAAPGTGARVHAELPTAPAQT